MATVAIILTVPHARSMHERFNSREHTYDKVAAKVAEEIESILKEISYIDVSGPIVGDINRTVCDLNRRDCSDFGSSFNSRLESIVDLKIKENYKYGVWIFDIHSYPLHDFDRDISPSGRTSYSHSHECYVIKNHQQNQPAIIAFQNMLVENTHSKALDLYDGGNNYIINTFGAKLNGQTILFEFEEFPLLSPSELRESLSNCLDGIKATVTHFFSPESGFRSISMDARLRLQKDLLLIGVPEKMCVYNIKKKSLECEHEFTYMDALLNLSKQKKLCPYC